jgi:hypothetical protein
MVLTEEMKRNLPLITEEELKEIRLSKEELIKRTLASFDRELKEEGLYD